MWKFAIFLVVLISVSSDQCDSTSDCMPLNKCTGGECKHNELSGLYYTEIIGLFLILIFSALSNAGGAGGGSLMVPILILLFYFTTQYAVPMAQVIIFGGSLVAFALKISKKHPTKDKPLIYYDIIVLLLPLILLGTSLGVILNQILPDWLILLLLCILSIYMTYMGAKKGFRLFKLETKSKKENRDRQLISTEEDNRDTNPPSNQQPATQRLYSFSRENLIPDPIGLNEIAPIERSRDMLSIRDREEKPRMSANLELMKIYLNESKMIPKKEMIIIIIIYILALLSAFLRGGRSTTSIVGIKPCSAAYIAFLVGYAVVMILLFFVISYFLVKDTSIKQGLGYEWDTQDIQWNYKRNNILGFIGFIAGVCAGMLGIGGGTILNPIFLVIGMRPEVTAATSSFIIFFTSSLSMIQYSVAGLIYYYYGLLLFGVAFIGSALGVIIVKKIVVKYDRASIIVICMAFILGISAVVILYYGISNFIDQQNKGTVQYGIKSIC